MKMFFKIAVITVILAAGWFAVFNIPDAVEGFLPAVKTVTMTPTEYNQTVSGAGIITQGRAGETLKPDGEWFVTVSVEESDIRRVEIGQSAEVSGAAFDDGIYTATVYEIDSLAVQHQAEQSGNGLIHETVVEVVLTIDNPDGGLRSGYTARVDIKTDRTQTVNIIPYSAILQDDIGEFVYVLLGNTVVRRDILTGLELSSGTQVISGLYEDDRVIVSPESITENTLASKIEETTQEINR